MSTQIFIGVAMVAGCLALIFVGIHAYPMILRSLRRKDTLVTFKSHFRGSAYPDSFLEAAYEHFQHLAGVRDFPVRPTDKLNTVYGLADEDLLDSLATLRKLAWDDSRLPDELPTLETVEDAIEFALTPFPI